jgi:hypothetical protein
VASAAYFYDRGFDKYGASTLKANPYVDRDFLTVNVKHNL